MNEIIELLNYDFMLNALIASILASVSCGFVGSYIVAKRIVFISGGITHASFGGIGIAYFLGFNPILGAAIFGVFSAMGIEFFSQHAKIRQDSSIAILWSLGMAIGIIFVFLTPGYAPNLMTYLFGSVLTVNITDIVLMALLSAVVVLFFIFFRKIILFIAFDKDYANTHNAPVQFFNYALMILIALTIVLNIRVVGISLVISLLTIPQTTANLFTKKFETIIIYSIIFALIGSFVRR